MTLEGKTVLLGVTGSIAAYKIAYLASALKKRHADVHAYFFYDVENFVKLIAMLCIELFINIAIFAIFLSFKPTNGINKYGVCAQKLSFF